MWIHPVDRPDAPAEIKLLGKAWMAHRTAPVRVVVSDDGRAKEISCPPQWAVDVFSAFAAEHPGFNPAECLTPAWVEEKRAAYAAAEAAAKEKKADRKAAILAALESGELSCLLEMGLTKYDFYELDLQIGSVEWRNKFRLVFGLGGKLIKIKG